VQAKLTNFERELIIGKRYAYYMHKGCGREVQMIGLVETHLIEKLFDWDLQAYNNWLEMLNTTIFDFVCLRCFEVIKAEEVCQSDGSYTYEPDPDKAKFVEEFKYVPYEEHVKIVKTAYDRVKKYKDGISTRDTWLAESIGKILKDERLQPSTLGTLEGWSWRAIGMPVVDWALKQGFFEVVKGVGYDIPYAYRKHGWRGIKATVYWRVLKPTERFEKVLK